MNKIHANRKQLLKRSDEIDKHLEKLNCDKKILSKRISLLGKEKAIILEQIKLDSEINTEFEIPEVTITEEELNKEMPLDQVPNDDD
jgi:hypothetical protein